MRVPPHPVDTLDIGARDLADVAAQAALGLRDGEAEVALGAALPGRGPVNAGRSGWRNAGHDRRSAGRSAGRSGWRSAGRDLALTPGYDGSGVGSRTIDTGTPRCITLLGSYAWIAKQLNLWRFLDVGADPLARAGIGIDVVGWIPDDFAKRLRVAFPDVMVTGRVDRVEPYLARSRMGVVAEEIGGGFKLKALDYVFNRLPVASLAGSVAGTPLVAGESILEFRDLTRLVEGLIGTIDDLTRLNAVQAAAFRACEGRFAWADRGRALAAALSELRTGAASGES